MAHYMVWATFYFVWRYDLRIPCSGGVDMFFALIRFRGDRYSLSRSLEVGNFFQGILLSEFRDPITRLRAGHSFGKQNY